MEHKSSIRPYGDDKRGIVHLQTGEQRRLRLLPPCPPSRRAAGPPQGANTELVASLTRNLTITSWGQDVKNLQMFLNDNGYPVAKTGLGSLGNEVFQFGARTAAALARFQAAHGIAPTGFFGPGTRAYLDAKY